MMAISYHKFRNKKSVRKKSTRSFQLLTGLFLVGSANGANTCTSAALDASTSIDNVLAITLGDSANGAFTSASAAAYTRTVDYVCHGIHLL